MAHRRCQDNTNFRQYSSASVRLLNKPGDNHLMKIAAMMLMLIGISGIAIATPSFPVPEISAGTAGSALALLTGTVLVIRGRRKH